MKFDLHIHSMYSSDSRCKPSHIMASAIKRGLNGLSLTDHNTMEGYRSIRKTHGLIIIPGMEISTDSGHVIALGIQEEIASKKSLEETLDDIYGQGGLAIASHPYRFWSGLGEKTIQKHIWSAIEVLNGRSGVISNQMAMRLAKSMKTPVVAGSDSHSLANIGKAYTLIESANNWEDVIQSIQKGKTFVDGTSRTLKETCCYVHKAVREWMGRGFTRI